MTPLLALMLLAAAEEGGGGGGLTDINLALVLWSIVLFALFAGVMGRFGWKPLLAMIEEREKSIRDAVEGSERANTEAKALLARHKELLDKAGQEREDILKAALLEADRLKSELSTKARAEADTLVHRAKEQIEREKGQALLEIRTQVADLAMEAAAKIVTSSLTPDAQRKLVNDFVASLPRA